MNAIGFYIPSQVGTSTRDGSLENAASVFLSWRPGNCRFTCSWCEKKVLFQTETNLNHTPFFATSGGEIVSLLHKMWRQNSVPLLWRRPRLMMERKETWNCHCGSPRAWLHRLSIHGSKWHDKRIDNVCCECYGNNKTSLGERTWYCRQVFFSEVYTSFGKAWKDSCRTKQNFYCLKSRQPWTRTKKIMQNEPGKCQKMGRKILTCQLIQNPLNVPPKGTMFSRVCTQGKNKHAPSFSNSSLFGFQSY